MWQKLYQTVTVTGPEFLLISVLFRDWEEDAQDTLQGGSEWKCSFRLQTKDSSQLLFEKHIYSPELQTTKQTFKQVRSS